MEVSGFFDVRNESLIIDEAFEEPLDSELRQKIEDFLRITRDAQDATPTAA